MPLSFEEFKKLRSEGLSEEQIAHFDQGGTPETIQTPVTTTKIPEPAQDAPKADWEAYYKANAPDKAGEFAQLAA